MEDDGGGFEPKKSSGALGALFGMDAAQQGAGNQSLRYTAPKQPKAGQPASANAGGGAPSSGGGGGGGMLFAAPVQLFKYNAQSASYDTVGAFGLALLSPPGQACQLLVYTAQKQTVCGALVHKDFPATFPRVQYCSFYDAQQQNWSIMVRTANEWRMLAMSLAVARFRAAGGDTVQALDVTVGRGEVLETGDSAAVRYTGLLVNEHGGIGNVFDSNVGKDKLFKFQIGAHAVIRGWEDGVVGMRKEGRRILVVPPSLAYGTAGAGPVPGNATLVFEIELVKVKRGAEPANAGAVAQAPVGGSPSAGAAAAPLPAPNGEVGNAGVTAEPGNTDLVARMRRLATAAHGGGGGSGGLGGPMLRPFTGESVPASGTPESMPQGAPGSHENPSAGGSSDTTGNSMAIVPIASGESEDSVGDASAGAAQRRGVEGDGTHSRAAGVADRPTAAPARAEPGNGISDRLLARLEDKVDKLVEATQAQYGRGRDRLSLRDVIEVLSAFRQKDEESSDEIDRLKSRVRELEDASREQQAHGITAGGNSGGASVPCSGDKEDREAEAEETAQRLREVERQLRREQRRATDLEAQREEDEDKIADLERRLREERARRKELAAANEALEVELAEVQATAKRARDASELRQQRHAEEIRRAEDSVAALQASLRSPGSGDGAVLSTASAAEVLKSSMGEVYDALCAAIDDGASLQGSEVHAIARNTIRSCTKRAVRRLMGERQEVPIAENAPERTANAEPVDHDTQPESLPTADVTGGDDIVSTS